MIRLLLVDDQHVVRAGLRMLCESADDIEVVGEARNGGEAVRLVATAAPDVVLMDLRMPGTDGVTATATIMASRPSTRVVVLTTFDDDEHLYPALSAGACGFLAKDVEPAELLDAIRKAAAGDTPFSGPVLRRLVGAAVRASAQDTVRSPELEITERECEVLALIGAGLSNADIAERLLIGVTTVKTHVANLMAKTDSANRVRLAVVAVQHGLVDG
ncbi:LuxR family two component transcriptional regulator [Herbihabitans rhizosphaerae]|uniref:LuxR family two component transcriptional regulator n=1 Tax=Herbihabitans rhizosphaerae TaxID=1872711 RepID=A0A4Q7L4H3_9PSEU|nr:response regulator transcription factor [Herbihabitans rhizosphaerae]RZS44529.1 LuxR family two component transcriptional regulator [Herbihabitans rhizosphaerae]